MRIALDKRGTEPGFKEHAGRGTGRYVEQLSQALEESIQSGVAEKLGLGAELELVHLKREDLSGGKFFSTIGKSLPLGRTTFEVQFAQNLSLNSRRLDLVHYFSHGDAPAFGKTPRVVTVLDLIPLKFEELYSGGPRTLRFKLARWLELQAIRSSVGIVAISEATKRDIVEILGIPAEKIRVTPLGVNPESIGANSIIGSRQMREQLSLPPERPVIAYLGGIDARKNLKFLIKLLSELKKCVPDVQSSPVLALAGRISRDREYKGLKKLIGELGLEGDVCELGFIENKDIASFLSCSDLFVFPSLYEGFGLPVIEAMLSGTPVICGDNSAMPELVDYKKQGENGAMLLPDGDLASWSAEITALLANKARMKDMAEAGKKRAKFFTWEHCAEETLCAYKYFQSSPGY